MEAQLRAAPAELHHVALAQQRLLQGPAGQEGALLRAAVQEHDVALALEHDRVPGRQPLDAHVRVVVGADGGRQAPELDLALALRGQDDEADLAGHRGCSADPSGSRRA
jgi:hypothetical protein